MGDGSSGRFNSKGKGPATQNGDILALDLGSAEEGSAAQNGGGAFMQMQLVEQQVHFLREASLMMSTHATSTYRTVIFKPVRQQ